MTPEPAPSSERRAAPKWVRIVGVLALLLGAWWIARHPSVAPHVSADGIAALVASAGAFGILAFIAAFSVGALMQIPGIAFLIAARIAFGPAVGLLVAYIGAVAAISFGFVAFRGIGGRRAATETNTDSGRGVRARLAQLGAKLEARPVRTLALLRTFFIVSPPLTAALAMSKLRFRDHLAGSALGLAAPVAVWVLGSGPLLACLGLAS